MGGWFAAHSVLVYYPHLEKEDCFGCALLTSFLGKAACFRKPGNLALFEGPTTLAAPSPLSNFERYPGGVSHRKKLLKIAR